MSSLLGSAADPAASTTTTTDTGATGNSGEHWSGKLGLPADAIDDKIRAFPGPKEFVESYKSAQKLISSKGYARPADDVSDPAAWDRFYSSVGRPTDPKDYAWQAPEGVSIDDARMGEVRTELHKAGLDKRQFAAVMDLYGREAKSQAERADREATELQGRTSAELKAEWGKDLDTKLARAKATATSLGILDTLDSTGLGNHKSVILALDRIAERIGEDSAVRGASSANLDSEIETINGQILKLSPSDPTLPALEKRRGELFAAKRSAKR